MADAEVMDEAAATRFLAEMTAYWEKQAATTKEDASYWAAVSNAENCRKIDRLLQSRKAT